MPIKSEIRKIAKEYRISLHNKKEVDEMICNSLISCNFYKNASEIFLYSPVKNEIDTSTIYKDAKTTGKRIAYPKCLDSNGNMEFYYINSIKELEKGLFGVLEPREENFATPNKSSLIIVPALAFDDFGGRVGYGKGYYDRYLKNQVAVSVGLCYNDLVFEISDKNNYDINVDFLITEHEVMAFK